MITEQSSWQTENCFGSVDSRAERRRCLTVVTHQVECWSQPGKLSVTSDSSRISKSVNYSEWTNDASLERTESQPSRNNTQSLLQMWTIRVFDANSEQYFREVFLSPERETENVISLVVYMLIETHWASQCSYLNISLISEKVLCFQRRESWWDQVWLLIGTCRFSRIRRNSHYSPRHLQSRFPFNTLSASNGFSFGGLGPSSVRKIQRRTKEQASVTLVPGWWYIPLGWHVRISYQWDCERNSQEALFHGTNPHDLTNATRCHTWRFGIRALCLVSGDLSWKVLLFSQDFFLVCSGGKTCLGCGDCAASCLLDSEADYRVPCFPQAVQWERITPVAPSVTQTALISIGKNCTTQLISEKKVFMSVRYTQSKKYGTGGQKDSIKCYRRSLRNTGRVLTGVNLDKKHQLGLYHHSTFQCIMSPSDAIEKFNALPSRIFDLLPLRKEDTKTGTEGCWDERRTFSWKKSQLSVSLAICLGHLPEIAVWYIHRSSLRVYFGIPARYLTLFWRPKAESNQLFGCFVAWTQKVSIVSISRWYSGQTLNQHTSGRWTKQMRCRQYVWKYRPIFHILSIQENLTKTHVSRKSSRYP